MKAQQNLTGAGRPGSSLTSIVVTPQQQQANGALQDTTSYTLVSGAAFAGVIEECDFDQEYEGEDVGLLSVAHAEETSGAKRTTAVLTELLKY